MGSGNRTTLIYGAIIGAVAGMAAAYIFLQKAGGEDYDEAPHLTASDGVKLGLGVLGLLKLVADTGETYE